MTASVRVGVIGTGLVADYIHLPILGSHQQAHVVALCGRNRERTEALAAKYGIHQCSQATRTCSPTPGWTPW